MKNILAVDTASKLMGVSLKVGDKTYSDFINDGFAHSENLLPMINKLLESGNINVKEIDLLICTRGPGSFTGLRIGMATLKGLSLGLGIPLISVPTLDLYAYGNENFKGDVLPILDARKRCFYTGIFNAGTKKTDDLDLPLEEILKKLKESDSIFLTGVDAELFYNKVLDDKRFILDKNYLKNYSENLIPLGLELYTNKGADDISQGPLYIRKSEAEIMLEKKSAE